MDRPSRRRLLRSGCRWLAVGGGAALAGCSGLGERDTYDVPPRSETTTTREATTAGGSGNDGSRVVEFDSVSPPDTGRSGYDQWLPAPDRILPEGEGYRLAYVEPFWIGAFADAVPAGFVEHRSTGKVGLDHFGIGFENYQWLLRVNDWTAVTVASFDRDAVAATLLGTGYGRSGEYRDLGLYVREDGPRAVALGDGVLLWSARRSTPAGDGPVDVLRALADAKADDVPRYRQVDDGFDALASAAGAPLVAHLFPGSSTYLRGWDLDGLAGWGTNWGFDRARFYRRTVFGFEDDRSAELRRRDLRRHVVRREFYMRADAVDLSADRRSASVVAAFDRDRYPELFGDAPSGVTYPQITWGYEHDPAESTVTVTHDGGDVMPAASLAVATTTTGEFRPFSGAHEVVTPNDALTVPGEPGDRLQVRWRSPRERRQVVIDRFDVPGR